MVGGAEQSSSQCMAVWQAQLKDREWLAVWRGWGREGVINLCLDDWDSEYLEMIQKLHFLMEFVYY